MLTLSILSGVQTVGAVVQGAIRTQENPKTLLDSAVMHATANTQTQETILAEALTWVRKEVQFDIGWIVLCDHWLYFLKRERRGESLSIEFTNARQRAKINFDTFVSQQGAEANNAKDHLIQSLAVAVSENEAKNILAATNALFNRVDREVYSKIKELAWFTKDNYEYVQISQVRLLTKISQLVSSAFEELGGRLTAHLPSAAGHADEQQGISTPVISRAPAEPAASTQRQLSPAERTAIINDLIRRAVAGLSADELARVAPASAAYASERLAPAHIAP